jgi:hypothetical protein
MRLVSPMDFREALTRELTLAAGSILPQDPGFQALAGAALLALSESFSAWQVAV